MRRFWYDQGCGFSGFLLLPRIPSSCVTIRKRFYHGLVVLLFPDEKNLAPSIK